MSTEKKQHWKCWHGCCTSYNQWSALAGSVLLLIYHRPPKAIAANRSWWSLKLIVPMGDWPWITPLSVVLWRHLHFTLRKERSCCCQQRPTQKPAFRSWVFPGEYGRVTVISYDIKQTGKHGKHHQSSPSFGFFWQIVWKTHLGLLPKYSSKSQNATKKPGNCCSDTESQQQTPATGSHAMQQERPGNGTMASRGHVARVTFIT